MARRASGSNQEIWEVLYAHLARYLAAGDSLRSDTPYCAGASRG